MPRRSRRIWLSGAVFAVVCGTTLRFDPDDCDCKPGGHADGEENVLSVAMREVNEETGLIHFKELVPGIFDIDIHTIPARADFPEHLHYDIRYALIATEDDEDIEVSAESHDVKWIALEEVPELCCNNSSILRMLAKTKAI